LDTLKHEKRALLTKDKVSSMRLATRDAIKLDHEKDYKCLKKRNRKKKTQSGDSPNTLRTKKIPEA
jgi:hypothetical protein